MVNKQIVLMAFELKPCPCCGSTDIQHWCGNDRYGQCVLHYYECEKCGRKAGFCDPATAIQRWNTLAPQERIAELEGFIRKHTCEQCDIKTVFADECKSCPIYGLLRGEI